MFSSLLRKWSLGPLSRVTKVYAKAHLNVILEIRSQQGQERGPLTKALDVPSKSVDH